MYSHPIRTCEDYEDIKKKDEKIKNRIDKYKSERFPEGLWQELKSARA